MTFDEAIPALVAVATRVFGAPTVGQSLIIRDASGSLTFVLREAPLDEPRARFDAGARAILGSYLADGVSTPDELFDDTLFLNTGAVRESVSLGENQSIEVHVLDRQIIGQDWLKPDFSITADVPVVTFFSCKGGVGRSTALAVAASDLSARGKNVTIIDFDLEAPGIGSILLRPDDVPEFGLLDYLIEARMDQLPGDFLERCIAPSPLTDGRGLVEIMPALGTTGRNHPSGVLPKLGRAFLSDTDSAGGEISFLKQMRSLVCQISKLGRADVIFIDARAGLSESSAPAVIGLGGEVLLFGVNTPQTFECYRYLLSHLKRFVPDEALENDWRYKLRMVHAKASLGQDAWNSFREHAYDIFADNLYEEAEGPTSDVFNFDMDDPVAPHYAWPILFDAEYAEFNPRSKHDALTKAFYDRSFGPFTENLYNLIFSEEQFDGD